MTEPRLSNCFVLYETILAAIDATPDQAYNRMWQNYETAITNYTADYILTIFANNYIANQKKYLELVALYDTDIDIFNPVSITESYTDIRTPNLQSSSSSTGSGTSDSKINQSRTQTVTPATTTTTSHSVNPYDNTGLQTETQDSTTDSGTNTTLETYSGQPDHTATSTTASSTVSTTGSERIEHQLTRSGRDGRFTLSEIIDQAEESAAKLNILDQIINDLADQIFLEMWV